VRQIAGKEKHNLRICVFGKVLEHNHEGYACDYVRNEQRNAEHARKPAFFIDIERKEGRKESRCDYHRKEQKRIFDGGPHIALFAEITDNLFEVVKSRARKSIAQYVVTLKRQNKGIYIDAYIEHAELQERKRDYQDVEQKLLPAALGFENTLFHRLLLLII